MVILWTTDFYVYFATDGILTARHISAKHILVYVKNVMNDCRAFPKTVYFAAHTAPTRSSRYSTIKIWSSAQLSDINFTVSGATAKSILS